MDLSDFTRTSSYMPDEVVYFDEETNENKTAKEVKLVWTHNTESSLSVHDMCIREGHEQYDEFVLREENRIAKKWMIELGYDPDLYITKEWTIVEKGKISEPDEIEEWLKPNHPTAISPITSEEI